MNVFAVRGLLLSLGGMALAAPPDFDYNFSGFKKLTQLLISDCNDPLGQVNKYI